jgi:NAD(P)-dependent dehydrogenase (short-subunit alcohol dehydrogenase family)
MTYRGILVTGGAAGIGGAISRAFLDAGDRVVVVDQNPAATAALSRDYGDRLQVLVGDVRDDGLLEQAVRTTVEWAGRLDVAVNNAGVAGPHRPLPQFSLDEYDLIMGVNVRGIFSAMRHELPVMLAAGRGSVINMASALGLVGAPDQSIYSASKHAVVGLTRSAALDAAGSGVRINCVCPGVIESDLSRDAMAANPGLAEAWKGLHPAGRLGQATEVAQAVLWLAGDQSSFVTGTSLSVDGGYTSR